MERSKILSRKRTIIVIASFITVMLILTLLPYGIEYGLIKALHDQGAEDASIDNVDFNPFTGRLVVQGLTLREDDKTPLNISELAIQISWRSLFKKRIYLEELTLEKSGLSIEQSGESGWKIGGLEIAGDESKAGQETKEEEPAAAPWEIGIEHLTIRSSLIKFKGMDLETELDIRALDIVNVKSWEPDLAAEIDFSGGLNKSGLNIKTSVLPFSASPSVKGTYSVDKLSLSPFSALLMKNGKITFESGSVSSEGRFEYSAGQEEDQINFSGGVTIDDLSLDGPSGIKLLSLKKLALREIKVGGLNDISIQSIELKGAKLLLLRKPDGKWHLIDDISGIQENVEDEEKPADDKSEPFRIRIASIMIGDNSSLRFEDESIEPPYRTELKLDKVEVHNIDSSSPESKSNWSIKGRIGDYSSLQFSGNIQPFAERLTIDMTGEIKQLDLHPLSSYSVKAVGYNVQSGHMDSDINIKITAGNIESENSLVLNNLMISPKDETKMDALATELGLSLESVLSLLRDSDGTIRFNLPMEGDVDNPDIKLEEIINKALGQAMKKTAFTYLKHAFQPYGALITIIQLAGEAARIQLDPVEFEAGVDTLSADAGEYIKTVAKLMKERPELQVSICGKVTTDDIAVLSEKAAEALQKKRTSYLPVELSDEQLLQFARERANTVKKHLIEDHGVEPGRLFICNPEINRDEKETPRADLLI